MTVADHPTAPDLDFDFDLDLDRLIPVVLVAAELNEPVDKLISQLGDSVFRDGAGIRSLTGATVRALIADREAAEAERREKLRQEAAEKKAAAKERHARQAALLEARRRREAENGGNMGGYNP